MEEKEEDGKAKCIVQYLQRGESDDDAKGSRCPYCKKEQSYFSQGMWGHILSPEKYERLIDIGWSRSGCFLYRPDNHKVCCPMYTIRNVIDKFTISKSQVKVLKKFKQKIEQGVDFSEPCAGGADKPVTHEVDVDIPDSAMVTKDSKVSNGVDCSQSTVTTTSSGDRQQKSQKKKHLRRERYHAKLISQGVNPGEVIKKAKTPDQEPMEPVDYFKFAPGAKHKLDIKLVKVNSPEFELTVEAEHVIYQKFQTGVHKDKVEDCDMATFRRFLCINPFTNATDMGTFHQQYFLDDKLIAVGVLDFLPRGAVSVYFFYDPFFSSLNLGTWSALQELFFVKNLSASNPSIKYYYLGYYIHNCAKMNYKRNFRPCQLLCPVTYHWTDFDQRVDSIMKSVQGGYAKLSEDEDAVSSSATTDLKSTDKVLIYQDGVVRQYQDYMESDPKDSSIVTHYLHHVTTSVASNMVLYIP